MRTRLIVLTIISLALMQAPIYAATCAVNANTVYQEIQGFGASNAWSDCGSCGGSALSSWLVTHADEFFTNTGSNIGLTILRARIPPDKGSWGSDAVNVIKAARDRGALIMATEWSPPAAWKSNGAVDNQNGAYLLTQYYGDYANYLRDYVIYMRDTHNVNIYAISPANEPDYQVGYDGCTWSGNQLRDFVKNNMGPVFAAAGLTSKIMVGESFNNALAITDPTLNDTAARDYTDIIAAHTYGAGPYNYPLCQTYNKDYWLTEKSSFEAYDGSMASGTPGHGMVTAKWIHSSLVTANYNSFIYWWLASDQKNEGLRGVNNGIAKRYWVMGNWSKYVRPGYRRIAATVNPVTGTYMSAYKDTGNTNYVIIAVNDTTSSQSMTFSLTGIGATSFVPHITSETQDLATLAAVAVSGSSFTYNLPAKSVISFVGAMPAGSPTRTATSTPYAGTPTFTVTPTSTPNSILLDDMEDGDTNNNWAGSWYSYSGQNTTITPKPFTMTTGGMTGSALYRAEIIATVADYCGMGTNLNSGGTGVDLTNYTAVEFWVKGNGGSYWFHFTQADITSGDYYGTAFTAPSVWTKVTVPIDQASLGKRGFGTETGPFTPGAIVALQWTSNGNGALDIQIENVAFLTSMALTPTNTPSRTATPASSPTFTASRTQTPTYTRTSTPVNTATLTHTLTYTQVNTATLTHTAVITATFTQTRTNTPAATATQTYTATAANTASHTATRTFTPVDTASSTATPSRTVSLTVTLTPTGTIPTATFTPVVTSTSTSLPTSTNTAMPTSTSTAMATATGTAVNTSTSTPTSNPPTSTLTSTPTSQLPTSTLTSTPTYTPTTRPPTSTLTSTPTFTRTYTQTFTSTRTATPSTTFTATPTNTPTSTATEIPATATATPTSTPTAEATKETLEITELMPYPNPYNPAGGSPLRLGFNLSRGVGYITVLMYTQSYRLVSKYTDPADREAGKGVAEVPAVKFGRAGSGTYYILVQAKNGSGKTVSSNVQALVIQR